MGTKFYLPLTAYFDTDPASDRPIVRMMTEPLFGGITRYYIDIHPTHVELWRGYERDTKMVRRLASYPTLLDCLTAFQAFVEKKRARRKRRAVQWQTITPTIC